LMLELQAETGLTLVLVTHDPSVASVAHRQIEVRDGLVVAETRSDAPAA